MKFAKIVILGAGAVGSIVGGLLSKENDVILVGNEAHVKAIRSNGLHLSGDVNATFHVDADTKIEHVAEDTLIFLMTKAQDTESAVSKVQKLLRKDTIIVVLQNGLGNEDVAKRAAGRQTKVLRGITNIGAELFEPGKVKYWRGKTTIQNGVASETIAHLMKTSGLETSLSKNIKHDVWNKLVVNSVVNPLTAIFRVRDFEIGTQTLARIRHQITKECVQVGETQGIAFPKDLARKIDREILSYNNFSSMCQDIINGKRTEIDFLNGKIVELGARNKVPVPMNEALVDFVKFLEEKNELPR